MHTGWQLPRYQARRRIPRDAAESARRGFVSLGNWLKEGGLVDSLKTILVVEDDSSIQSLMALVLEEQGYRVETAANGRQGLDVFEQCSPDLILLDMNMPVMNGWEFARELRATHDSQVPIVVVTASAEAKKAAEDIGAVGCISKPFELEALLRAVSQFIIAH